MSLPALRTKNALYPGLYHYHQGDQVGCGGVQSLVFEPAFSLPLRDIVGGYTMAGNGPSPLQPPMVYSFPQHPTIGIGGLVTGQFVSQPLNVPGNGTE
jgi:hypothetical protein